MHKNVVTFGKFAVHIKSLNRSEHRRDLYTASFLKGRTAVDDVGKPSSHLPQDLITRWSRGCHHFLSFVFGVNTCFALNFVVFYLWVNSDDITHWQSRHAGWFQILYLGSCPLSIDRKISLISSEKCLASLIWEPIFFQIQMGSLEFGFKLIGVFSFQKSMQILFIDRALPTVRCMHKILGNVSPSPYSPKIMVAYGELHIYFAVQILPFIEWLTDLNGWDDTEFASRSNVEWCDIHQWGIRLI